MERKQTAQNASNQRDDILHALAASSFQQMYTLNAVLSESALLCGQILPSTLFVWSCAGGMHIRKVGVGGWCCCCRRWLGNVVRRTRGTCTSVDGQEGTCKPTVHFVNASQRFKNGQSFASAMACL
eukprot:8461174-Ditylum_brightwellii.AAC.1